MRLLLAEDEVELANALSAVLKHKNYSVDAVYNGIDAYNYAIAQDYDGIILDIMMPGMDGIQVLTKLREKGIDSPVLLLTAKSDIDDRITGLDSGADDYLTKPFGIMELAARIKALLRRSGRSASDSASDKITAGGITVNTSLREVSRDGRPIELTLKEYELLLYLLKNRARVVSREELLTKVWGIDFVGETRTLDMHIGTLRKKLSDDAENAHLIKTVRGVGYRFIGE